MTRGALECSFFVCLHVHMMEKNEIKAMAEEFLKDSSDYLVDVIVAADGTITVEIDNDNGVNIDDCVKLSRYLESKLDRDVEDFELTVTSAGLTSPFKTPRQYKKYEGKEIEVLTRKGEKLKGTLKSSTEKNFSVEVARMVKPEGAKRKTEIKEELIFPYDEVKYTKYIIKF